MAKHVALWGGMTLLVFLTACQTRHAVEVAPVEVKPIHITIDVNVRIQKALEDFFGEIDAAEEDIEPLPAEKPTDETTINPNTTRGGGS
jgi:hypothetical protein